MKPMADSAQDPTDEQRDILENKKGARVRIVAAAPGSGKTWLVGQIVRRELETWSSPGGIAALSFTRTARDAIADALGGQLPPPPHFVGTLDSFVYRYILRVFGRAVDDWLGDVSLVPAEVANRMGDAWRKKNLTLDVGGSRVHLFHIHARRPKSGVIQFAYRPRFGGPMQPVPQAKLSYVTKQKEWLWRTVRVASHSDIAFLAWQIVTHADHGALARSLLRKRFPMLVVDEVQDTGWFLGSIVHALLGEADARGVIVGDQDQSIYQFAGALPRDFERFEQLAGAEHYPMRTTFRCSSKVCEVASKLSWRGSTVNPKTGAPAGTTVMYVYQNVPDIDALCRSIEEELGAHPVTVLSRAQSGLNKLRDTVTAGSPDFGSRALGHIWEATARLRRGEARKAMGASSAALSQVAFGSEVSRKTDLDLLGLDDESWRRLSISALTRAFDLPVTGDLFEWGLAANEVLLTTLDPYLERKTVTRRAKKPKKATKGMNVAELFTSAPTTARRCTTVHSAKGETHEATLLFVPKVNKNRCPATTWFSEDDDHAEGKSSRYPVLTPIRPGERRS
ncbi:MAG: UvrD-helicase domain-containing protein [Myxococcota bacterium]